MSAKYERVLPRDLFNEAKLLKCLGQLSLLIHEGKVRWPLHLEHFTPAGWDGFVVDQNPASGGLFVRNLRLILGNRRITVESCYNSKDAFPLVFTDPVRGEGEVFNEDGSLSDEFSAYLDSLTSEKT